MRNLLSLLAVFFLGPLYLAAQITITAADFRFYKRDSIEEVHCDTTGVLAPSSGANMTWDFSGLTTSSSFTTTTSPHVSSYNSASNFPSSNIVNVRLGVEYYYKISPSSLKALGNFDKTKGGLNGAYQVYSNPQKILQFPSTYGDTFSDSLIINSLSGLPIGQKQHLSCTIIGYGKLVLPKGVYNDVLLKETITVTDFYPNSNVKGEVVAYQFYAKNYNWPLFQYRIWRTHENGIKLTSGKYVIQHIQHTNISIDEFFDDDLLVEAYPIPTRDNLNIKGIESPTAFTLLNSIGAIVLQGELTEEAAVIDLFELPQGSYFLKLNLKSRIQTLKIIRQ